jgi:hypothetical protein
VCKGKGEDRMENVDIVLDGERYDADPEEEAKTVHENDDQENLALEYEAEQFMAQFDDDPSPYDGTYSEM